jgi:hypothetical protein
MRWRRKRRMVPAEDLEDALVKWLAAEFAAQKVERDLARCHEAREQLVESPCERCAERDRREAEEMGGVA